MKEADLYSKVEEKENEVYRTVAEKLGWAGSASFLEYIETLFTPEEGKLLLELLAPTTCQELAKRLKVDEKNLSAKLDNLTRRGLLFRGKTEYQFQIGLHAMFAQIVNNAPEYIPPGYFRKWRPVTREVLQHGVASRAQRARATGVPMSRIIPARLAIAASPRIRPEQVLWYEDMAQILAREEVVAVVGCGCRQEWQNCDRPLGVCLHFDKSWVEYELNRGSAMKKLSLEEAVAASDLAETGGLLHLSGNHAGIPPHIMCNCCACCCEVFGPALRSGTVRQRYSPSRYLATVDEELCIGCQECVERCFFDAIVMRKAATSKKLKADVISENCMGCGLCVVGCKQKALAFELVRTPEHIPPALPHMPPPLDLLSNPAVPSSVADIVEWLK